MGLVLAFLGLFFIYPIFEVIKDAFVDTSGAFSVAYFKEIFADPLYRAGLMNAFKLACASTLLTFLIATPMAWASSRYAFWGKSFFGLLILLPIMLPPFVGAIGVKHILGQYGALNSLLQSIGVLAEGHTIDWLGAQRFWGIVVLNALSLYPILYLNQLAAFSNIDTSLDAAAANLGCSGWQKFWRVHVPLARSGMFAGGTIVFIWTFTELGVPLIFDYRVVTPVQIFDGLKDMGSSPLPYALVTILFVITTLLYLLGKGTLGKARYAMMAKASSQVTETRLSKAAQALCVTGFSLVTALALLPHIGVIFIAFSSDWYGSIFPTGWTLQNFELALGHRLTLASIQNSLIYSLLAIALNVAIGLIVGFLVVRTRVPGRAFLDALTMLPLAVPGIVVAFGYLAMTQHGDFFSFLNPPDAPNPIVLLIIAYAVRKLPFVVRSVVAGLEQTSETYEEAAMSLGATRLRALLLVTFPLITASILAGALLAFSQSMLEVSDSLILASKQEHYPITKAIYDLLGFLGDGKFIASALGVWAMVLLALAIGGASVLLGRKLGAVFRI